MIEIENKNEKVKTKMNYYHRMPIVPLLGDNHCLPLLHMAKKFNWLEEEKKNVLMSLKLDI